MHRLFLTLIAASGIHNFYCRRRVFPPQRELRAVCVCVAGVVAVLVRSSTTLSCVSSLRDEPEDSLVDRLVGPST